MYQSKRIDNEVLIKVLRDAIKYNESISNKQGIKRATELLKLIDDIEDGHMEQWNIVRGENK